MLWRFAFQDTIVRLQALSRWSVLITIIPLVAHFNAVLVRRCRLLAPSTRTRRSLLTQEQQTRAQYKDARPIALAVTCDMYQITYSLHVSLFWREHGLRIVLYPHDCQKHH